MNRILRGLTVALCMLAITACGNDDHAEVPLAYVPADTPYLLANLEPLELGVQNSMLAHYNAQLPAQLAQYRQFADQLATEEPKLANLLNAVIAELEGKTIQQFATDNGFDLRGLSALYGLGLSPVLRFELADGAKFEDLLLRLEDAYGTSLPKTTLGDITYRGLALADAGLQVVIGVDDTHAVLALLPVHADESLLRLALGLERPEKSMLEAERLADIAESNGYLPYIVGYLDLTELPELLIDGNDPLLTAMRNASNDEGEADPVPGRRPASCRDDLERMASRMPMVSFGYTVLEPTRATQQTNIHLADDIVEAFSSVPTPLPGLGAATDAPFDFALALPLEQARKFWTAQIDAIIANPFTCPAFAPINAKVADLRPKVQMLAIPPFGTLRGIRVSLDRIAAKQGSGVPDFSARVLIASTNPRGLVALAQTVMPALAQVSLTADGTPVALPQAATVKSGQRGWVAMTDQAIALGLGTGAGGRLVAMLDAPVGEPGDLASMHLAGNMYRALIEAVIDMADMPSTDDDDAEAQQHAQIKALREQAERIKQISMQVQMEPQGLEITATTELR